MTPMDVEFLILFLDGILITQFSLSERDGSWYAVWQLKAQFFGYVSSAATNVSTQYSPKTTSEGH